jgi:pimeloyl-ACP methyl ester carboxylesterase
MKVIPFFLLFVLFAACGGGAELRWDSANDKRPAFAPQYAFAVKETEYPKGYKMAYTDEGSGDTAIVFIHGLGGYLKHWEAVADSLKGSARCIAVDLPGYGKSSRAEFAAEDFMDFYADAVLHLIGELQLKTVVLAGHSMGGQIAMITALKAPEKIAALVLAAPAGFETFSSTEGYAMKSFATADFFAKQGEEEIRKSFEANFFQMPPQAEQLIQERLAMRNSYGFEAYCQTVANGVKGMLDHPVREQLPNIRQKTLVLFGANDLLIPNRLMHKDLTTQQVAEEGTKALPNARMVMIPEAGHLLTFEKPQAVAAEIRQFLKPLSGSADR